MDNDITRIRVDREGPLAVLVMDGAKKRNALASPSRGELLATVRRLMHEEPQVRAIVLTGAGEHFCAGADVSQMGQASIVRGRFNINETGETVREIAGGPKPVVAALEGTVFGMGLSLAAACDFVVASRTARMCAAFARIGLVPDTGAFWSLPARVGMPAARELMQLAREVAGEEALRLGLVDRLAEPGDALAQARSLALELAQLPPMAIALTKAALTFRSATLDESLRAEVDYQPILRQTADHQEAARAFLEKRKPVFQGL